MCFRIEQFCFKSIQVNGIANCFSMSNFFQKVHKFPKKNSQFWLDCFIYKISGLRLFRAEIFGND